MKSKPNKGWIKELAKKPAAQKKPAPFTYAKPVVPQAVKADGMRTPYRMREFKSAKEPKSNIVIEQTEHIKKRRGES